MDVLHEDWDEDDDEGEGEDIEALDRELDEALRGRSTKRVRQALNNRYGRTGMLDDDAYHFGPYSVKLWTVVQLKNRLKWLHGQKASIFGKPGKEEQAKELQRKIRKYTRELFKRYSPERLQQERDEANRRRRTKRARARQRKSVALVKKWFAERKAKRKTMKLLEKTLTAVPSTSP